MAITYNSVDLRGKAAQEVFGELFFLNKTLGEGYVGVEDNVKASTIFTESDNSVTLQPYVSSAPTSAGTIGLTDTLITPAKYMAYVEFDPESLRKSRFGASMASGAWNIMSSEFEQKVLGTYGDQISAEAEYKFWNGILTGTTKSTIATLTGTTSAAERSFAANTAVASEFDGVLSKLIVNTKRVQISGTGITYSNIATEYAKAYAGVVTAKLLAGRVKPVIYAPQGHEALINIYNANATYRDLFSKDSNGKYFYNGLEIRFVPFASQNVIVIALPYFINWCTDLTSDANTLVIDKIAPNREDMFLKAVFTLEAYVANQANIVLYVG